MADRGGTGGQGRKLQRRRWRPAVGIGSLLSGLLLGLGSSILLQQYAVRPITRAYLLQTVVAALVVAIVVPSVAKAFGVRRYNNALRKAGLL